MKHVLILVNVEKLYLLILVHEYELNCTNNEYCILLTNIKKD